MSILSTESKSIIDETSFIGCGLTQIQDGDIIRIDAAKHSIDAPSIDDAEWQRRREGWKPPPLKYMSGVLYKYTKLVSSASLGCVTDL